MEALLFPRPCSLLGSTGQWIGTSGDAPVASDSWLCAPLPRNSLSRQEGLRWLCSCGPEKALGRPDGGLLVLGGSSHTEGPRLLTRPDSVPAADSSPCAHQVGHRRVLMYRVQAEALGGFHRRTQCFPMRALAHAAPSSSGHRAAPPDHTNARQAQAPALHGLLHAPPLRPSYWPALPRSAI